MTSYGYEFNLDDYIQRWPHIEMTVHKGDLVWHWSRDNCIQMTYRHDFR